METWRDIPGYEDIYLCSDQGKIKRIGRAQGARIGRILKQTKIPNDTLVVGLSKNGNHQVRPIHQIVAETFIGPCPKGQEVNHKNGNRADNFIENLEYVTHQENQWHAYHVLGTLKFPIMHGEDNPSSKLTADQVQEIRNLAKNEQYSNVKLGEMFGVSNVMIGKIVRRENWKHI